MHITTYLYTKVKRMSLVSTRIPDEVDQELEVYAKREKVGKTIALRRVLDIGLKDIKKEFALSQYQEGKLSLMKAAQEAGLSLWEMIDIVRERQIPLAYTKHDLEEDFKAAMNE